MSSKDLHSKPFDDSTISKLEIFEDYAEAWIPTFVLSGFKVVCICDFFAGTGYDKNRVPGSPIRILAKLKEHLALIRKMKVAVLLFFNEFEPDKSSQKKFKELETNCRTYLNENEDLKDSIDLNLRNKDFSVLFDELLPIIKKEPSLVYLDQNGIKFLSSHYVNELAKTKRTDFLYFLSASYFWRFGTTSEFQNHLDIDMAEAKKRPYRLIHRSILNQLKTKLPSGSNVRLYPYTIKKGSNIYGIIFGASHPRAVDKFLSIAWKRNDINGQANFDIEDERSNAQLDLFKPVKLSKIEAFQKEVKEMILRKMIKNNKELLDFTYEKAHLPKHAADVIKKLKNDGLIAYEGPNPGISYVSVFKKKNLVKYNLLIYESKQN